MKPEIQELFDENIDSAKTVEQLQLPEVSFLKIAQSICETEAEFQGFFRVIARTISAKELTLLLQSSEYWFTPATHMLLIREILECGMGYKKGESSHFLVGEEVQTITNVLESCERLVTDRDSLFAVINILIPGTGMEDRHANIKFKKMIHWIKKISLPPKEMFDFLRKKSIHLASQFVGSWDDVQEMSTRSLTVPKAAVIVHALQSSASWKIVDYSV